MLGGIATPAANQYLYGVKDDDIGWEINDKEVKYMSTYLKIFIN
jgi:hypothetical protein